MPNTFKVSQSNVVCGLGTWTHTAAITSPYIVMVNTTNHTGSSVSIVIQLNGTPVATSTAPAATQRVENLQIVVACTAADVVSVVISSAAVTDNQLNNVKSIINMHPGST